MNNTVLVIFEVDAENMGQVSREFSVRKVDEIPGIGGTIRMAQGPLAEKILEVYNND